MEDDSRLADIETQDLPGPTVPQVVVSLLDGQVNVIHEGISVLAIPTLLRIAARTVEQKFDL